MKHTVHIILIAALLFTFAASAADQRPRRELPDAERAQIEAALPANAPAATDQARKLLIYDGNGITTHPSRKDIKIFRVDAADEASKMSSTRTFNMIVLGGYLKIKPVVKLENVMAGLKKSLPPRYNHLIPVNEAAIKRGMEVVYEISEA